MSFVVEKNISRPEVVLENIPLKEELRSQVEQDRKELFEILEGKDKRKFLIIGPCSAWPDKAVVEYARRLKPIADEVKDKIKIIMRVYTQKPRTTVGWTGPINQPDPFQEPDIQKGIEYCRKMMIEVIEAGLPVADEALFTHNSGYFNDLITWLAVGARSTEDQEHRIFASMLDVPVGMKNPTSGNLTIGVNSVIAAQFNHVFLLRGEQVKSTGNKHAHLILRGGNKKSNVDEENLLAANELMHGVFNPGIVVDVSHDNSIHPETGRKDPLRQSLVLMDVIDIMKKEKELFSTIKGFMVESFLKTGNQKAKQGMDMGGLSITDACIGIEETEDLIKKLYSQL